MIPDGTGDRCPEPPARLVDKLSNLVFADRLSDIELAWVMVAMVPLLVLGAIAVIEHNSFRCDRPEVAAKRELVAIQQAMEMYWLGHDHPPDSLEQLVDEQLLREYPVDPWGTDYQSYVRRDGKGLGLRSAGPDGDYGTSDDVYLEDLD